MKSLLAILLLLVAGSWALDEERNINNPCASTGMGPYDYKQALCMSYVFYEAQRSGDLPGDQRVTWRQDSAMGDGSDVGKDLTGGYYDAGDHVKFGFPMAFTATMLGWGLIDFEQGHSNAGQLDYGRDALKWATDYFLKAHTGYFELYGQVGDGYSDHSFWGRPEDMTMYRPAWKIDTNAPGSDLAGETAAALAAASIVFQNVDPGYATECLNVARELYQFADERRELYHNSITQAADFYKSWSGYGDELCWSALWLYRATGESSYLDAAKNHWNSFGIMNPPSEFSWDNKNAGAMALFTLLQPGDGTYSGPLQQFLNNIRNMPTTPGGMVFIQQWGSTRHAANVAFIGLMAAKLGIDAGTNQAWAESQINYILGSSGRSFVVQFGSNFPQRPHHRSSSCPDIPEYCDGNWAQYQDGANPQYLYGALVGGPDQGGSYVDDRNDYVKNEVACDYNAAFTAALAAMVETH
ncbi:hypothetical protein Pmani_004489 [Petrolisthes manimaculis]|uniref:Endoglucanase n=1 Tax=Petrolisthes manimaculis TaxID=1843537 RepID=A0AAE1UHH8_9EUCA|nr:hypothetical protein Pmani_004489 [Petrolisthes manimaculis]